MELLRRIDVSINYQAPQSVGTIKVAEVHGDGDAFCTVYLDIEHEDDDGSCYVFRVPKKMAIQQGDVVEVVVKRESELGRVTGRLGAFMSGGKYFDKVWRLAIRKFDPTTYGKGLENDKTVNDMFEENFMESRGTKAFYERFVKSS